MSTKRDHAAMEQRRLQAARLFEQGIRPAEVARRCQVRRQSAHEWFKLWQAHGSAGLRSKGKAGRKSRLSADQLQHLKTVLLQGPLAQGYTTDLWTLPRVALLIRELTGHKYHPGHVWHLLRSLGLSCQRPTRRALERDEAQIAHWKNHQWPAIKKKRVGKAARSSSSTRAD